MLKKLGRPSPATVIACMALFFAIAGGSAIALQGRNTVDSGDIKPNAVKKSDIANNAVTTGKIKNNHVRAADIQNNAVGTGEIRNGQVRTADIAPAESIHLIGAPGEPAFGNGGEGDCIWSSAPSIALPYAYRLNPAGFFKDALGYVHLTGFLFPQSGPGGDGSCGGAAGETSEDTIAFVLPEGYRPLNDELRVGSGGAAVIIGTTPLSDPPDFFPAGAVTAISPGGPILLDGTVFEPVGAAGGIPRRGVSRSARTSGGEQPPESLADLFG